MFAKDIQILNDGKINGEGSVFYSINHSFKPKTDYYGYEWEEKKLIGLIGFHTGTMEEFGGWSKTLNVEYQDDNLKWKPVEGLKMIPALVNKDNTDIKPDFVEYLLAFNPVSTKAIRIIGNAGGGDHWFSHNKTPYFTSITELSVHEPLPELISSTLSYVDTSKDSELKIYPNPCAGGMVYIQKEGISRNSMLNIFDLVGNKVYSSNEPVNEAFIISPEKLNLKGYYIARLIADKSIYTGKFFVE